APPSPQGEGSDRGSCTSPRGEVEIAQRFRVRGNRPRRIASAHPRADPMTDRSTAVRFDHVSRHFGSVRAVDDVSFEIRDGEFFSMLGPSGSGKTTCLRLIAGFELPTAGHLLLHGSDVSATPPYDRDVNTVFQDYALFPHMSVWENVAYGLMIR